MLVIGEYLAAPFETTRAADRAILAEAGADLAVVHTIEEWEALAPQADGVLHNGIPLPASRLALLTQCRIIAHHAVGVDMIDTAEAARLGIIVANVPRYGADDVADHAMMLLLACARKLPLQIELGGHDSWNVNDVAPIYRLRGRTIGIIGIGNIGLEVAKRAASFGLKVIAFDPFTSAERFAANGIEQVSFDELLGRANFLTVHLPLTPETRDLIDTAALAKLPTGAIVINVARGPVINEPALIAALESGHLAAAGLDVFGQEPVPLDAAIRTAPNTIITPHLAFYSTSSIESMQLDAAREVAAALKGTIPPNPAILHNISWQHAFDRWGLRAGTV